MSRLLRLMIVRGTVQSIGLSSTDSNVSVTQGFSADIPLTLARTNFTDPVTLSASGLPSGVTASFSVGTLTGAQTDSILTLTASGSAGLVTDAPITILADGGGGVTASVAGLVTVTSSGVAPTTVERFAYADNAAFLANVGNYASGKKYTSIAGGGVVSLDTGTLYNGAPTAKFRYYTGMPVIDPKFTVNNPSGGNPKLLLSWPTRFSPGFRNDLNNGYGGAKALKTIQIGFSGVNGRVLVTQTGGTADGGASLQAETVTRTNEDTFTNITARNIKSGSDDPYNDGLWYRAALYFERLDSHSYRAAFFWGRDEATLTCYATFVMRDQKVTTVNGIFDMDIGFKMNPLEAGTAGAGIDQWFNIGGWECWRDADVPAHTSLNAIPHPVTGLSYLPIPDFTNNDFTASFDDTTFTMAPGGSSATRTLTVSRGSGFSTSTVTLITTTSGAGSPVYGFSLPANVTASFSATSLASGVNSCTLQLTAGAGATPGTYTAYLYLKIAKTAVGGATQCIPITITVT